MPYALGSESAIYAVICVTIRVPELAVLPLAIPKARTCSDTPVECWPHGLWLGLGLPEAWWCFAGLARASAASQQVVLILHRLFHSRVASCTTAPPANPVTHTRQLQEAQDTGTYVSILCRFAVPFGCSLKLVGNHPALGAWDIAAAPGMHALLSPPLSACPKPALPHAVPYQGLAPFQIDNR